MDVSWAGAQDCVCALLEKEREKPAIWQSSILVGPSKAPELSIEN